MRVTVNRGNRKTQLGVMATVCSIVAISAVFAGRFADAAETDVIRGDIDNRPPPGRTRSLSVPAVTEPPVIDGKLDDDAWLAVPRSGGFWVSDQERWPDEETEVQVVRDEQFLYVAFRAYDSAPQTIRAIEAVRDRGLGFDDHVLVEIDAYGDHDSISKFFVNARGTQDDAIAGGRATNITWKGDWDAAATLTDDGWTAELAIPFNMLNYRENESEFFVNFVRYHNRTRQWSRWADVTPQNKKEEMGRLVDISPPGREHVDNWTPMVFVLAGKNIPDRAGDVKDYLLTAGLDVRYTPRSSFTGLLSLNPDFSQVETQITDANFSYNEKGVADPRVFFREGSEYFGEDDRIFYSPRVPDFDAGAKVFGQNGAIRFSGLATAAPDSRRDGVVRVAFAPDPTHNGSLMLVSSDRDGGDGTTVAIGLEGREQIGSIWSIDVIETTNNIGDQGSQSGTLIDVSAGWQGDHLSAGLGYDKYDNGFFPTNGLIKTDRLGTTAQTAYVSYFRSFGGAAISERSFDIVNSYRKTDDGRTQNQNLYVGGSLEFNEFVRFGVSWSDGEYRPTTGNGPGDFGDIVNQDRFWTASVDFNTRSSRFGYGSAVSSGDLGGSNYEYLIAYVWARPSNTTSLSMSAERLESFGIFEQYIVEAGWDINPMNSLVFRHISFAGDPYWRLGYRRAVAQGLDVFLLFNEEPGSDAELSAKFLWVF